MRIVIMNCIRNNKFKGRNRYEKKYNYNNYVIVINCDNNARINNRYL